jgi:hypothetical protein
MKEIELPENRHQYILKDEVIEFKNEIFKAKYSKKLRRIWGWGAFTFMSYYVKCLKIINERIVFNEFNLCVFLIINRPY